MASAREGHIFLSHAGIDTEAAHVFAENLRRNGLNVWFDTDNIAPGDSWMATLERAILEASAMVVYVGRLGVQAWVDREVRYGLVRNTQDSSSFRLIPVLGEGADAAGLPPFLQEQQWVDLRDRNRAPEQIRRLVETLKKPSERPAISGEYWTTHSPFRSLQVFEAEDSWLFFGRDTDADELLARLGRLSVLAVLGNSGCGKSSLIRAGLIPALQRGRFRSSGAWVDSWRVAVFRPAGNPFDELAKSLLRDLGSEMSVTQRGAFIEYCREKLPRRGDALRNSLDIMRLPKGTHVLLIADQFEEIFTLTTDPKVRHAYIDGLLAAAQLQSDVPVHLVLVLRADFYANCLEHSELSRRLETNLYNVPRITPSQLREAIEQRLAITAAHAAPGLLDSLLADVGEEPGDLALLEHTLGQLWEKRELGNTLTNEAYVSMGRMRGALGRHADQVYREIGDEAKKHLMQRIFLELVHLGEGAQDTRRRVAKDNLLRLGRHEEVEQLLSCLVSSRLIATGGEGKEGFVEVSHEALIREWPALREWLTQSRENLRLERRLLDSAEEWQRLNRDAGALLQGARLVQGEECLGTRPEANRLLREFVLASAEARKQAERKERAAQEHTRRAAIRFRWLSYALILSLLVALGAVWRARQQQRVAESHTLAALAEEMVERDQPSALNLAFMAWKRDKTAESQHAVAASFPQLVATLQGTGGPGSGVVFSPDGQRIVTTGWDPTAMLWDGRSGRFVGAFHGEIHPLDPAVFSPDGKRIVTVSEDRTAQVWDTNDGQLLATLRGHTAGVVSAVFSPEGQRIVTASKDKTARVWDVNNNRLLATLQGHTSSLYSAMFSPDGKQIVTASDDGTARVWDAAGGQLLATLGGLTSPSGSAMFSPDGQRIVTTNEDNTARVWNTFGGLLSVLKGHTGRLRRAEFSPDGRRIVTASHDMTARVWDSESGQLLTTLQDHTGPVVNASFSPDGQWILTASMDDTARVWSSGGQLLAILQGHTGPVVHAMFSPDGQRVVTASVDSTARLWNIAASGQLLGTLRGHTDPVWGATYSANGQRIITNSYDQTAMVWDASRDELVATFRGHTGPVMHAVFSPDGERILTASEDSTARVWRASDSQLLFTLQGHTGSVRSAMFSPDGQRILTASDDKTACIWNAASGQLLIKLQGHSGPVRSAVFSPDGQRILTASDDGTARVWNASGSQVLVVFGIQDLPYGTAVFSPDGQRIFTANRDSTGSVWNASNGRLLTTLQGHSGGLVTAVFSSDGRRIVTASWDLTARVWDADSGQLLAILKGHSAPLSSAVFSPNNQHILTASLDNTARTFRLVTLTEIAHMLAK